MMQKSHDIIEVKKKHIIGSVIGNACEWYDYVIYASLAPILSIIFFPKSDKIVALMLTFAVFAAGFLIRPIGGIIFGSIADKYGRKPAFIYSILLMALPALAIGLLPSYNSIGRLSVLLLLIFRLIQGLAIGGEYPTMITYIAEISSPKNRGYIGSYASVTTVAGVLLATITVAVITKTLSHNQLMNFGWRIPFFITFTTILVGYYVRTHLPESMLFLSGKTRSAHPIKEAIKENKIAMLRIFCYIICVSISYYTFNAFSTTYFTTILKLNYLTALYISIGSTLLLLMLLPLAGYFSDLYGRKNITISALAGIILLIYPIYIGLSQKLLWVSLVSQSVFAILIALYLAPLAAMIAEQVSTKLRCSSLAIAYNCVLAIFGGTAPVVNMYIISHFNSNLAPSFYIMIAGIISLIATLFMRDLTGKNLL